MKLNDQMEITFDMGASPRRQSRRRQTRLERARWWFRRMHEAVERAAEWQSAPPARPEQTYMKLPRRDLSKAA
jgi:hypothetical protein